MGARARAPGAPSRRAAGPPVHAGARSSRFRAGNRPRLTGTWARPVIVSRNDGGAEGRPIIAAVRGPPGGLPLCGAPESPDAEAVGRIEEPVHAPEGGRRRRRDATRDGLPELGL